MRMEEKNRLWFLAGPNDRNIGLNPCQFFNYASIQKNFNLAPCG